MKPNHFRSVLLAALLGMSIVLLGLNRSTMQAIEGGQYVLEWQAVGFGGGESIGGDYALSSTVGQASADELTGGTYSLGGGFWGGGARVVVPVVPAPAATPTVTPTPPGGPLPTATATPTPPGNAGGTQLYLPLVDR